MRRQQFDEFVHIGAQQRAAAKTYPCRMAFEQVGCIEHDQVGVSDGINGQPGEDAHP